MDAKALIYLSLIALTLIAPLTDTAVGKETSAVEHNSNSDAKKIFIETSQAADGAIMPQAGAFEWFRATVPLLQALVWPVAAVIIEVVFKFKPDAIKQI